MSRDSLLMPWLNIKEYISLYIRNLSVRWQLFFAGALSIGLLLCLCVYGIIQLDATNRQTSKLTNTDMPALQTTNTIYIEFLKFSNTADKKLQNSMSLTIDKEFDTLLRYDLTVAEFEKLQQLCKLWASYKTKVQHDSPDFLNDIEDAIIGLQDAITEKARLKSIKVGNLFSITRQRFFLLLVAGIFLICVFYYFLTKRFLATLNQGLGLVRAMQRGDLSARISIKDNNEVGTLCQALNKACLALEEKARLESEQNEKIYQANKLISLGTLVAGVAHEINNPNSNITFNIPLLDKLLSDLFDYIEQLSPSAEELVIADFEYPEFKENIVGMLDTIGKSAHRIKVIIDGLRDYSRPVVEPHSFNRIEVCELINTTFMLIGRQLHKSIRQVDLDLPTDKIYIVGNFIRLEQVLVNIFNNAKEAMLDIPHSVLSLHIEEKENTVSIVIRDNGTGIDKDTLKQITDPFFTTKRSINGTGLGLSVVDAIMTEHNALISFDSKAGKGTTVTLTFSKEK